MSTESDIIELYKKERQYQKSLHGEYTDAIQLSFPSFVIFLRRYLDKIEEAYTEGWVEEKPSWLASSEEFNKSGSAPIKSYMELIKLFTLAGAALETYTEIDVKQWRCELNDSQQIQ
jgi:hypothetical protein